MGHLPNCRWEKTTAEECAFRDTHFYCPHPEHACTCEDEKAKKIEQTEQELQKQLLGAPKGMTDEKWNGKLTTLMQHSDGKVYIDTGISDPLDATNLSILSDECFHLNSLVNKRGAEIEQLQREVVQNISREEELRDEIKRLKSEWLLRTIHKEGDGLVNVYIERKDYDSALAEIAELKLLVETNEEEVRRLHIVISAFNQKKKGL